MAINYFPFFKDPSTAAPTTMNPTTVTTTTVTTGSTEGIYSKYLLEKEKSKSQNCSISILPSKVQNHEDIENLIEPQKLEFKVDVASQDFIVGDANQSLEENLLFKALEEDFGMYFTINTICHSYETSITNAY